MDSGDDIFAVLAAIADGSNEQLPPPSPRPPPKSKESPMLRLGDRVVSREEAGEKRTEDDERVATSTPVRGALAERSHMIAAAAARDGSDSEATEGDDGEPEFACEADLYRSSSSDLDRRSFILQSRVGIGAARDADEERLEERIWRQNRECVTRASCPRSCGAAGWPCD